MVNFAPEKRYSQEDMYLLYGKARTYAQTGRWRNAVWLRRDMDVERKKDVQKKQKSMQRRRTTTIWWHSDWWTGGPILSPYATERVLLPLEPTLCPQLQSLYFADFYCQDVHNRHIHYVILVVCRIGSYEDLFCTKNLVKLPWDDNPFLTAVDNGMRYTYRVSSGNQKSSSYLVHLFYAHDIDLKNAATRWDSNMMIGQGQRALEVNSDCPHCNMASTATAAGA